MTNFNGASGAGAPVDLHLPETFHRLKRTVMLLSGALIVLAFTTSSATREIKLTLIDIAVPTPIALWLLWGAAAYYLVGFWTEAKMARLLNSETILSQGMVNLDKALGKVAVTIQHHDEALAGFKSQADEELLRFAGTTQHAMTAEGVKNMMLSMMQSIGHPDPTRIESAVSRIARDVEETDQRQRIAVSQMEHALRQIGISVDQIRSRREDLSTFLNNTHQDLNRLSARISGDRKASFYWWEIGGAAAAFGIGTLLNIQSMAAGAKRGGF